MSFSFLLQGSAKMSSSAPPSAPVSVMHSSPLIKIYGHSSLFYWWPVWALGFILVIISLFDNDRVIHITSDAQITQTENNEYKLSSAKHGEKLSSLLYKYELPKTQQQQDDHRVPPRLSHRYWMGATFCVILLIVIVITNVPLRGLWSIIAIVTIVLLSVIFGLAGWWDSIFYAIGGLHIFIGMAGYLFIATVLFIMWMITMFMFDRQIYITFQAGQMKVCEEVGGGEKSYDTAGMSIEKHRDDLFRHWVLGLGSGDLTVRTSARPRIRSRSTMCFLSARNCA